MISWFYDQMMIWFDMMMIPNINQMIFMIWLVNNDQIHMISYD